MMANRATPPPIAAPSIVVLIPVPPDLEPWTTASASIQLLSCWTNPSLHVVTEHGVNWKLFGQVFRPEPLSTEQVATSPGVQAVKGRNKWGFSLGSETRRGEARGRRE